VTKRHAARSVSIALSRAPAGLNAPPVRVEVHIGSGLPAFALVGLPEAVVRESRERVRSALLTSGFEFPAGRITVNLAPADLPKEGGRFDLPIALGILAASDQLPPRALTNREFYGELALSGELRETPKLLPALVEGRARPMNWSFPPPMPMKQAGSRAHESSSPAICSRSAKRSGAPRPWRRPARGSDRQAARHPTSRRCAGNSSRSARSRSPRRALTACS